MKRWEGDPKRKVLRFFDAGENQDYSVPNNSFNNLYRGLVERVFLIKDDDGQYVEPPAPEPGHFRRTLRQFRTRLINRAPPTAEITCDQFIASRISRKRKVYESARDDLEVREISRKDARWDTFIKAEKMNLTEKPNPVPRLIFPRSPRYNLLLGVYISPAEHAIYSAIDDLMGARVVAKGKNAVERGSMLYDAWMAIPGGVAIGVDASRFDQHVSKQALEWEHSVYNALFQNDPQLRRLLSWQLINKGFAKSKTGGISFTRVGGRGSGDMNTALGNVLLMCAMLWTFMKTEMKCKYRLVDDGDDAVVIIPRRYEQQFYAKCKPWFKKMGFTMKYESSAYQFENIDFCQTRPVWDGKQWVCCRDPRYVLAKDLISVQGFQSAKSWKNLMGSVGLSGMALAGNLPIFWIYYKNFQPGSGERQLETGMDYLARGLEVKSSAPTDDCRASFFAAFNISPDEQLALEDFYRNMMTGWADPVLRGNSNFQPPHDLLNCAIVR